LATTEIIFTTREYILNQAKHDYEELSGADFELTKMIIDINRYNNKIKAEILYNHLHFSSLPNEYVYELLVDYSFLEIINHKNYNPRIVEHLTDIKLLRKSDVEVEEYSEYFLDNLDNPIKIWSDIFEHDKISFEAKILIYTLFIEDIREERGSYIDTFKEKFYKLYDYYLSEGICQKKELVFDKALKELDNSFIRISQDYSQDNVLNFYDPSINDFLLQYLDEHTTVLVEIIKGLELFSASHKLYTMTNIINLKNEKYGKRITFNNTLQKLFVHEMIKDKYFGINYAKIVDSILEKNNIKDEKLENKMKQMLEEFYLYTNEDNLKIVLPLKSEFIPFIHGIETVYDFYLLSKKYNIHKHTNQELYDFAMYAIEMDSIVSSLYSFTYLTNIAGIKRNKRKETKVINEFINNFIEMVFELDDLDEIDGWEEMYAYEFNVQVWNDRFRDRYKELSNELKQRKIEELEQNEYCIENINEEEITNLFEGLR